MKRVVIESPLSAATPEEKARNIRYARAACRHSIYLGEAPFASHLLYDQPDLLDDGIESERELGIKAGLAFVRDADATVVYTDLGISNGMKMGIEEAERVGRPVIYRSLPNWE